MEYQDKKYVALVQGSEMSAGWHFRNLTLRKDFYKITFINVDKKVLTTN